MDEVAQKMFRIYDLDGNGVIDNKEYMSNTRSDYTSHRREDDDYVIQRRKRGWN